MTAIAFYLYDPAQNLTAAEVLVSLPLLNVYNYGRYLTKMPSGKVMVMEGYDGSPSAVQHATRYTCLLTVNGNTITAGAAENTGHSSANYSPNVLASPSGAHIFYGGAIARSYVEGLGWGASAMPLPHNTAYYTSGDRNGSNYPLPNGAGWVFCVNSGSQHATYVLLTSANAPGSGVVYAKKL
jgi:hypothetical protein